MLPSHSDEIGRPPKRKQPGTLSGQPPPPAVGAPLDLANPEDAKRTTNQQRTLTHALVELARRGRVRSATLAPGDYLLVVRLLRTRTGYRKTETVLCLFRASQPVEPNQAGGRTLD
jgi:hypothetical protein